MVTTIESLSTGFPYPTVLPIVGEPNYESIAELHKQLNANSSSIPSHLGDGQLGLLYLTVTDDVYNTLSAVPFVPPVNPGPTPDHPDGATAAQITDFRFTYKTNAALFSEYNLADKALKQLLLGAVESMFVRSLTTRHVGYLNVTTNQLLQHLYTEYARISASDLLANDVKFKTPYDPNLPIESLFEQIEDAVDYAAAGNTPYTAPQVLACAFQLVFATGMFLEDCKLWKRRAADYKTYPQFKLDFAVSHRELRETRTTAAGAGYQAANSVTQSANDVHQQETADAIANFATATAHDRETVATLTATNNALTTELTAVNRKLVTALHEVTKLTAKLGRAGGAEVLEPKHYCWTCGFRCTHPSHECLNPKAGHKKKATKSDIMGGSTKNQPTP
jgi:hypothetical protein